MYCSHCGHQAAGNFFANCGTSLAASSEASNAEFDWRNSCDYERIAAMADVRKEVEKAKHAAANCVSGAQLLQFIDSAATPLTGGVSSVAIARLMQPVTAKLGLKTGKQRRETFKAPPGLVLAKLAIVLARIEHESVTADAGDDTCHLVVRLPADLRSMEARLEIDVARLAGGTEVAAAATVDGAWYDWGKCRRGLDRLFDGLRNAA